MNDTSLGSTRLWHPRGVLVTLAVPADPLEAFAHVGRCLDAGWLPAAPGLGQDEKKEDVGFVLRGEHEGAPFLLLYSADESLAYSLVKVYLDRPEQIAAFEFASGLRLEELPLYVGNDKPQRGYSPRVDSYIIPTKKSVAAVVKQNPRFSEAERATVQGRGEVYRVPKRIFVRWFEQAPSMAPPATNAAAKSDNAPTTLKSGSATTDPATQAASKKTPTPAGAHSQTLAGLRAAQDVAQADSWLTWGTRQPRTALQRREQEAAHRAALDRIQARWESRHEPTTSKPVGPSPHCGGNSRIGRIQPGPARS